MTEAAHQLERGRILREIDLVIYHAGNEERLSGVSGSCVRRQYSACLPPDSSHTSLLGHSNRATVICSFLALVASLSESSLTFPGGKEEILELYDFRRSPIKGETDKGMPSINCDLQASKTYLVKSTEAYHFTSFFPQPETTTLKLDALSKEFNGKPEILLLHAYCIAQLRKKRQHPRAIKLLYRLWTEEAEFLIKSLTPRWLLSALISFGDHGVNEQQRTCGTAFQVFFSMMKLYEVERKFSGISPRAAFELGHKSSDPSPVGLGDYSIPNGDLHISLLGRLYILSLGDPLTEKISGRLLELLNADDGNIFRRLRIMKSRHEQSHFHDLGRDD